jgi:hypothetical protein
MESQERTKQNLTAIVTLDEVGIYKGYNSFWSKIRNTATGGLLSPRTKDIDLNVETSNVLLIAYYKKRRASSNTMRFYDFLLL